MENKLTLDQSDSDVAEALSGCEVGKQETLTLKVTPTSITPDGPITFDVDEVHYSAGSEDTEAPADEPKETEADAEPTSSKRAPAIALVLGGK